MEEAFYFNKPGPPGWELARGKSQDRFKIYLCNENEQLINNFLTHTRSQQVGSHS